MNPNYEKVILSEFLTRKKPQSQIRLILCRTCNNYLQISQKIPPNNKTKFGVFAPPPRAPQSNIKKAKKQESKQSTAIFKELQHKNLYESEFHEASKRPRQNQIKVIIKLFHLYQSQNKLRCVIANDIKFFQKWFNSDFRQPKMMKSQSIASAPNQYLKNEMNKKEYQKKMNLENQEGLYHLFYLKWIKKISNHNEAVLALISQAFVTAIFAVRQWDPDRERKLKKQVVEWKFELSD